MSESSHSTEEQQKTGEIYVAIISVFKDNIPMFFGPGPHTSAWFGMFMCALPLYIQPSPSLSLSPSPPLSLALLIINREMCY